MQQFVQLRLLTIVSFLIEWIEFLKISLISFTGNFLGQAPAHLKFIGNIDFISMIRSDVAFWQVGVNKIIKAIENGEVLSNDMKKLYDTSKKINQFTTRFEHVLIVCGTRKRQYNMVSIQH